MKKSTTKKNKNLFLFFWTGLLVIDQLTKFIAAKMGEAGILSVVQNKGIAFGINVPVAVPIALSVAAVFVIAYYYKDIIRKKALSVFSALILGGALGNLVDRLLFGFVRDFINLKIWPSFNLADAGLTIGIIGLIAYIWLKKA